MKKRLILKIFLWTLGVILLLAGILFAIGYFYYGKIVKNYVIETVSHASKGIYKAEIGSLSLDILNGNFTVKRFQIIPDTALYQKMKASDTLAPLLISIKIDEFRIRGFRVMEAMKNRRIDVKRIHFTSPEVTIFRMKMAEKKTDEKPKEKMMSIPLPNGLSGILIEEFLVEKAKLEFVDCLGDSVVIHNFPVADINIKNIIVDSAHQGKRRLFNADDISITLGGYSQMTKNGLNKLSFGEIGISTQKEEVYIKNFHLEPQYNYEDYAHKLGFQTDRLDVRVSELRIQRLNLRQLLFEGKVIAGLITIDSLFLDDYRDKRVARKAGFKPPMPQDGLRKLKSYLKIDTILLKNGKADYAEQVNEKPGTIFFDKMSATLTNFTNDSVLLAAGLVTELKGTAYLMGKGKLDVTMRLLLGDPKNTFTFTAQMGPVDLTTINPMLSNLLPARVEKGSIKKLIVPLVRANDDEAKGKLIFYYNNLVVSVVDKKQNTWSKIKTGVINFVANDLVVNNDNPTKSGKLHTGTVFFKRDKEKGIINFLWKSTLSGLKSTMGFNSKAQKAMIQAEKDQKK